MKTIKIILLLSVVLFYSCSNDFPVIEDFGRTNYQLITQDSTNFNFPKIVYFLFIAILQIIMLIQKIGVKSVKIYMIFLVNILKIAL